MSDPRSPILQAIDHQRQAMDQLLGQQQPWAQEAFYQISESVRVLVALAQHESRYVYLDKKIPA